MIEKNVLILSAGRRVELVECFKNAAKEMQIKSLIIACDCSETAPALYFADKSYIIPQIINRNYIETIITICINESISLIVPTIDTELLLLAKNKDLIEKSTKAKVLISDINVIEICRNKIKTQKFMESNGFKIPHMYSNEEIQENNIKYPLFIKPIDGSSSFNTFKISNMDEMLMHKKAIENPIIQEFIEGDEFTVDIFLDFASRIITIVPRQRIATRSGEISKGKIIKDREIIDEIRRLMELLKPIGHITVQLMKTKKGIEFIEINPRFGGGAPMSIKSGADSCKNLLKLLLDEEIHYNEDYTDNLLFLRFDSCICLNQNMEIVG